MSNPPTHHTRPMHQTQAIDQGPPTNAIPPIPKPRVGQGRAGIRWMPKIAPITPKPTQTPTPPIPTLATRGAPPLPQPVAQSQERTLLQHHVPAAPLPIVHPTPAHIT